MSDKLLLPQLHTSFADEAAIQAATDTSPAPAWKPKIFNYSHAAKVLKVALEKTDIASNEPVKLPNVPLPALSFLDYFRSRREGHKFAHFPSVEKDSQTRNAANPAATPLLAFRGNSFEEYQQQVRAKKQVAGEVKKMLNGIPFEQKREKPQKSVLSTAGGVVFAMVAPYPTALGLAATMTGQGIKTKEIRLEFPVNEKGEKSWLPALVLDEDLLQAYQKQLGHSEEHKRTKNNPNSNIPSTVGQTRFERSYRGENVLRKASTFIPWKSPENEGKDFTQKLQDSIGQDYRNSIIRG